MTSHARGLTLKDIQYRGTYLNTFDGDNSWWFYVSDDAIHGNRTVVSIKIDSDSTLEIR